MTDAELMAECERIAPLIGITINYFRVDDVLIKKMGKTWGDSRRREYIDSGKFRILTHYLPDYIFAQLGIPTFAEGQALLPAILADEHASGLWRLLLHNPLDAGVLGILKDRLQEMEVTLV